MTELGFVPSNSAPTHHPPAELLIDYASGAASDAESLVLATHLVGCAECRAAVTLCDRIGGLAIDQAPPAWLPPNLLNRALAEIDGAGRRAETRTRIPGRLGERWPSPLRARIADHRLNRWRWLPAGFRALRVPCEGDASRVWIMKAPAGRGPLLHTHLRDEWTVVLEGGFSDETGVYGAGDFAYAGAGDAHHPIAEPGEGCVCLLLVRDPPRYLTWAGRLLAPLTRL